MLLGSLNPAIFSPAWFAMHGLLSQDLADNANVNVVSPQVTEFQAERLDLTVTQERLVCGTTQEPSELARPPSPTLVAQQEWEGMVLSVNSVDFVARLLDITAGATYEEEEATIPLSDLSDDDRAKVEIGAVFRWVVGYENRRWHEATRPRSSSATCRE